VCQRLPETVLVKLLTDGRELPIFVDVLPVQMRIVVTEILPCAKYTWWNDITYSCQLNIHLERFGFKNYRAGLYFLKIQSSVLSYRVHIVHFE
jgi:hypothetical protein